jgi:hypothetical protein
MAKATRQDPENWRAWFRNSVPRKFSEYARANFPVAVRLFEFALTFARIAASSSEKRGQLFISETLSVAQDRARIADDWRMVKISAPISSTI